MMPQWAAARERDPNQRDPPRRRGGDGAAELERFANPETNGHLLASEPMPRVSGVPAKRAGDRPFATSESSSSNRCPIQRRVAAQSKKSPAAGSAPSSCSIAAFTALGAALTDACFSCASISPVRKPAVPASRYCRSTLRRSGSGDECGLGIVTGLFLSGGEFEEPGQGSGRSGTQRPWRAPGQSVMQSIFWRPPEFVILLQPSCHKGYSTLHA